VTQRLALLAIDASRGENASTNSAGASAMRGIRDGLIHLSEDVHALSYRLHPSILEDLGLLEALRIECDQFSRVENVGINVKTEGLFDGLPGATALCLFRIVQEALRNVARHAKARAVQISLRHREDQLELMVSDDGAGFNPVQHRLRPSLGLASMVERVHLLDGKLHIESAPGIGTTIKAWLPLREELHEPATHLAG
jgi:signal transduction histidine kinase